MSLKSRFKPAAVGGETQFTCPQYQAVSGSKRCRHYGDGGACTVPGKDRCTEWLRLNAGEKHPEEGIPESPPSPIPDAVPQPEPAPAAPQAPKQRRDLLGNPLPPPPPPQPPEEKPEPVRSAAQPAKPRPEIPIVRNINDEEIASFKALGASVCIRTEHVGDVWLVAEYTGKDRQELSVAHAATLTAICAAFPGAKVTQFVREKPGEAAPGEVPLSPNEAPDALLKVDGSKGGSE